MGSAMVLPDRSEVFQSVRAPSHSGKDAVSGSDSTFFARLTSSLRETDPHVAVCRLRCFSGEESAGVALSSSEDRHADGLAGD